MKSEGKAGRTRRTNSNRSNSARRTLVSILYSSFERRGMSQAPSTTTVAPWVPRRVIRRRRAGRGNRVSLCLNRRIYGNFQPRRFFQRPRAVDARAATTVLSSKLSPTTLHYNNTAVLHSNNKWYDPASQSTGVYTCDDIVTSLKFDGVRSRKQRLAFGKGDCGVLCVVDKPGDLSALASNMSVADDEAIFANHGNERLAKDNRSACIAAT